MSSTDGFVAVVPVSFQKVPPAEISMKLREFEADGWTRARNTAIQRVALMRKEYTEPVSERSVEMELRGVMGAYYVNLAAPGSPRNLSDPHSVLTGTQTPEIVRGSQPASDENAEFESGGGQIVLAPTSPPLE